MGTLGVAQHEKSDQGPRLGATRNQDEDRKRTLPRVTSITDVAERQLCTGCGVCAYLQPGEITMVDDRKSGRRPLVNRSPDGAPPSTDEALQVCPGASLGHPAKPEPEVDGVDPMWGPVLEIWEGYAAAPDIRFSASSGGAATALALHGIECGMTHGILHIRARPSEPLRNETVLSHDREAMLSATGSRYAPASPCDRLDLIESAPGPCTFIGKPCDVAAAQRARKIRSALDCNLGLTIAIFCAGTPTYRGTSEMLKLMGIEDESTVKSVRYRGNGWPGEAEAIVETSEGGTESRRLSYDESWGGVLQKHRQWRCYVCADHTGEFADVAVGDPWYRPIEPDEHGWSLVIARTEVGRRAIQAAIDDGYLVAKNMPGSSIGASQPGLSKGRGAVWGRTTASRLLGIPSPRYSGLPMFRAWLRLPFVKKLRSTLGLVRRAHRKRLWSRHPVEPM